MVGYNLYCKECLYLTYRDCSGERVAKARDLKWSREEMEMGWQGGGKK